jgi:hypothetical protein
VLHRGMHGIACGKRSGAHLNGHVQATVIGKRACPPDTRPVEKVRIVSFPAIAEGDKRKPRRRLETSRL